MCVQCAVCVKLLGEGEERKIIFHRVVIWLTPIGSHVSASMRFRGRFHASCVPRTSKKSEKKKAEGSVINNHTNSSKNTLGKGRVQTKKGTDHV